MIGTTNMVLMITNQCETDGKLHILSPKVSLTLIDTILGQEGPPWIKSHSSLSVNARDFFLHKLFLKKHLRNLFYFKEKSR
jgi:hypothetical protein